jgi:hypothetical protein
MTKRPKVFLSYAKADQPLADRLLRTLRSMSVDVWSDSELQAGDSWSDRLRSELLDSNLFVFLLTPQTRESSWVYQELGAAFALGKEIVAVTSDSRLIDGLPIQDSRIRFVPADEMDKLETIIERVA